jgi:biotin-(acetyl-CoA carboxylase) ligase
MKIKFDPKYFRAENTSSQNFIDSLKNKFSVIGKGVLIKSELKQDLNTIADKIKSKEELLITSETLNSVDTITSQAIEKFRNELLKQFYKDSKISK